MSRDADNQSPAPGLIDSIKRVARTAGATVQNRMELFTLELQEEGIRAVGALLLSGVILLFSGLALIMGMFTILLAVAPEHRVLAGSIMTLILIATAAVAAFWLRKRLKTWSAFTSTRAELHKDKEWLQSNRS